MQPYREGMSARAQTQWRCELIVFAKFTTYSNHVTTLD